MHLYAFLSQVLPMSDTAIEKLYAYARLLALRLPAREPGPPIDLDVELIHLRLVSGGQQAITLPGQSVVLDPAFTGDGTGPAYLPCTEHLSEIIRRFNDTFGRDMTDADRLHLLGLLSDIAEDPLVQQQAAANNLGSFEVPFNEALTGKAVGRVAPLSCRDRCRRGSAIQRAPGAGSGSWCRRREVALRRHQWRASTPWRGRSYGRTG